MDYIEDASIHLYNGKYKKLIENFNSEKESYYLETNDFHSPWGEVILQLQKSAETSKLIKKHDELVNHAYYDMDDAENEEIEEEIVCRIKKIVSDLSDSKLKYNETRIKECLKFNINGRDYRIHWGKRKWIVLDCIDFKKQYKFPLKVIYANYSSYRLELKKVDDVSNLEPYIKMLYE